MTKDSKKFEQIIQELVKEPNSSRDDLDSFKRRVAKKYEIPCPSNVQLLTAYHEMVRNKRLLPSPHIESLLRTRPVRSLSGIVNVSILTKPYPCPGRCLFCPSEKGIPKSYLAKEPAVQRAILNKFSPYRQVQSRLEALQTIGHPIDKIELRIIGGTWSYYPKKYQLWFIKECFRACNELKPDSLTNLTAARFVKPGGNSILVKKAMAELTRISESKKELIKELIKQQKKNEKARCRLIGITVETRPDYINLQEIKRMRELGITRVELGVQSIYDDVLKLNKRGHKIAATIQATKLLKDAGCKVSYQMMPNLPGSNFKKDVAMFKELFSNPNFKPDLLKIYPLALVKETPLYRWYQKKKFKPYTKEELLKLLQAIKKHLPYWCRVERIVRDIPAAKIVEGGAKTSNLREMVQAQLAVKQEKCKCIRCREVGREYNPEETLYLFRQDYQASDGQEIFLTFENKPRARLYALLRLRVPQARFGGQVRLHVNQNHSRCILPVLRGAVIIREIHTYGQLARIDRVRDSINSPQHRGLGKKLMKEAERIASKEFGVHPVKSCKAGISPEAKLFNRVKKIAVISGVGVRPYYRKLGYKLENTYMVKNLATKKS